MDRPKPNVKALLPIIVFLVLYLGNGIYFEYIHPTKGQMGFYVMSVVVAFVIALVVALLQNPKLSFDQKIHACAQGIGDDNITIMLFIFLMAGAFSGIASAAGGATSTANLLLDIIPANFAIPGLFIIACFSYPGSACTASDGSLLQFQIYALRFPCAYRICPSSPA